MYLWRCNLNFIIINSMDSRVKNLFTFSSKWTIDKEQFLFNGSVYLVFMYALTVIYGMLWEDSILPMIFWLFSLFVLIAYFSLLMKRLHSVGKSWNWVWLLLLAHLVLGYMVSITPALGWFSIVPSLLLDIGIVYALYKAPDITQ